jgi:protein-S-isoprenylcysteine O-methyltransferase Ste14
MPENPSPPHPGVRFPPPFLYVGALAIAWLLESRVKRFRFVGADESTAAIETAGVFLVILGAALGFWGMLTFLRARTAIIPIKAASKLVETGPYRISRNPMYTGMSIAYLGLMLLLNWGWALVLFPVVIVLLHRFVIGKEERYLLAEFGDEYREYCRRVRRWI